MTKLKNIFIAILAINILFINNTYGNELLLVKDMETENLVKDILTPILKSANVNSKSISVYLINNETPNAFVFAGQNIFIHTGLLTTADQVDEIAGVLAHELGHITAGHLSRGDLLYSKANIFVLLGLAAFLLTAPLLGNAGAAVDIIGFLSYGINQVAQSSALSYSRGEENQADELALQYIANTPYNTNGLYNFMYKLYELENKIVYTDSIYGWYSTHPLTQSRLSFIENYAKQNPRVMVLKDPKIISLNNRLNRVKAKIYSYKLNYTDFNNLYKNKNSNDAIYGRMIAEYRENNREKALFYGNQLKKIYGNDIYLNDLLGDIYSDNNNFNQAIYYYQLVLENIEDDGITSFKLAKSYFNINKIEESLKYTNISIQINPYNPSSWHLKSVLMSKLNKDNLADLATAHRYLILNDYNRASFFATKALNNLQPKTKDWQEAFDILAQIQGKK
jgi:predicted Zn-dependent protease